MEGLIATTTLQKIQAGSGLAFSFFLGLHLANEWLAPLGQVAYDEIQAIFRDYYQSPRYAEPTFVLLPLVVHALASWLLVYRRWQKASAKKVSDSVATPRASPPWHLQLHRYTG